MILENFGGGGRIFSKGGEGRSCFFFMGFFVNGEGRILEIVVWVCGGKGFVFLFRFLVLIDWGIIIFFKIVGLFFLLLIFSCKEVCLGFFFIWKLGFNEVLKLVFFLVGSVKFFFGYFIVGVRFFVIVWCFLVFVSFFCVLVCCKKKKGKYVFENRRILI